jgi:SAM-dependent methyltransferase
VNERDYHDRHYGGEAAAIAASPLFARVHERSVRQFLRATRLRGNGRLLSLGCGDGAIECRLAPYVAEIVGVDISSVAIAQARARADAAGLRNLSFAVSQTADIGDLGVFDAVAAFAFVHHLEPAAVRAALRAARKALRPCGWFYSTDPSQRRLVGLFAAMVRDSYERYHSPDERELDPEALAAEAVAAGFLRPAIAYTDYFLGPLAWLAPSTPRWLVAALEVADNAALRVPLLRRYASSFSLLAHAPA